MAASDRVCVCIYMYIYVYIYVYICIYIYTYVYIYYVMDTTIHAATTTTDDAAVPSLHHHHHSHHQPTTYHQTTGGPAPHGDQLQRPNGGVWPRRGRQGRHGLLPTAQGTCVCARACAVQTWTRSLCTPLASLNHNQLISLFTPNT
jgi:hypothetical protein